jgi:hypothetical protein
MENLIAAIHDSILDRWSDSRSIPVSQLPDFQGAKVSKLIVHYSPAWFVALLHPTEDMVIVTYSKVEAPADLPHILLNEDHITTKQYFAKYPAKYLFVQESAEPGFYLTEFYNKDGVLFNTRNCSIGEFMYHIENEFSGF